MTKEKNSIEFNKKIVIKKLKARIIVILVLLIVFFGFLLINFKQQSILLGALLSLLLTDVFMLVDMWINIYETLDNQRTRFITNIFRIHRDFNKRVREQMIKDCALEYINSLFNFVYIEAKNEYTIYTLTDEFAKINDYIARVFISFESHAIKEEINKFYEKIILKCEKKEKKDIEAKAVEIMNKDWNEINVSELEYVVLDDNYEGVSNGQKNRIAMEMSEILLNGNAESALKQNTSRVFWNSFREGMFSKDSLFLLLIAIFLFIIYASNIIVMK